MTVPCHHCTDMLRFMDSPVTVVKGAAIGEGIRSSVAAGSGVNGLRKVLGYPFSNNGLKGWRVHFQQNMGQFSLICNRWHCEMNDNRDESNPQATSRKHGCIQL
ncbi:hypothetical protein CSKR_110546 [Clonorchis sinensis]|uniref:Uncharacterized protein n=1 Tax=Clonorchis sinensis TaxID=79923 RepID=A0A3R7CJL2_CLOSI|nr:hypothetical protein CSKR_110546 [Clonorchis sinensis]